MKNNRWFFDDSEFMAEIRSADSHRVDYEIEGEEKKYAQWITQLMISEHRFELSRTHFVKNENLGFFFGFLGQQVFRGLLLEWKVPHVYADPIYKKWKEYRSINGKDFDFYVAGVGRIEVVTAQPDKIQGFEDFFEPQTINDFKQTQRTRFIRSVSRFSHCDYYVGIKILDAKTARMYGYLSNTQVKNLQSSYGKYQTPLIHMNPATKFKEMLKSKGANQ